MFDNNEELDVCFNNDLAISFRATLFENFKKYYALSQKKLIEMNEFISSLPQDLPHREIGLTQQLYGLFSAMENFFTDSTIDFLTGYPGKIKKPNLSKNELGGQSSLTSSIKLIAQKQVYEIAYKPLPDYLNYVYDLFGEKVDSFLSVGDRRQVLVEAKSRRDVLMHNGGEVNHLYIQRTRECGSRALKKEELVKLDPNYLSEVEVVVKGLIEDFYNRCLHKHKNDNKINVFRRMWEMSSLNKLVSFEKQWEITSYETIHIKDFKYGWSGTEQLLFNFFRHIHDASKSGLQTEQLNIRDIGNALYYWKGYPDERIIMSWLEAPFML